MGRVGETGEGEGGRGAAFKVANPVHKGETMLIVGAICQTGDMDNVTKVIPGITIHVP